MTDALLVVGLVALAIAGYRRGAIVSAGSGLTVVAFAAVGVGLGMLLGGRGMVLALGLAAAAAGAILFGLRIRDVQDVVQDRVPEAWHQFDRSIGAVANVVVGLWLVWIASAALFYAPGAGGPAGALRDSRIGQAVRNVVSPTGDFAASVLRSGLIPGLDGPVVIADEPDAALLTVPAVRAAALSVVQVEGQACGQVTTGTGWVVSPGLVVTNAHVIAGHSVTLVRKTGSQDREPASPVAFDALNDLALLRVPSLDAPPLERVTAPRHGSSGVTIGFPNGFELTLYAARFDRVIAYAVADIYGQRSAPIDIVLFRGEVHAGNSGSPIVDQRGKVMGTVSAAALEQAFDGGYAVPDSVLGRLLATTARAGRVSTGACIQGNGPRDL